MHNKSVQLALVVVFFGLGMGGPGAVIAALDAPANPSPVIVPEGNGAPVITDGIFSPGEWDDALRIPVSETVELCLKEYRVHGLKSSGIGSSEINFPHRRIN